jgi:hypothetical protein
VPPLVNACTSAGGANCSGSYADGTLVTLTATPVAGNSFTSWSGACAAFGNALSATVTMSEARTCGATFASVAAPTFPLTVTVSGNGSVSDNFGLIGCGAACSGNYADGTLVTLTAAPNFGYVLNSWSGACAAFGNALSATLTMSEARTCGATFILASGTHPGSVASIPTLSQWTLLLLGALTAAMALMFLAFREQKPEIGNR